MLPRKRTQGFTLIELLIVVAIIGILAAVALPMYNSQLVKARLTEVMNSMGSISSALGIYRQEAVANGVGGWPDCPDLVAIRNSLGLSVPVSRISSAKIDPANGEIEIVIGNIDGTVNGRTLTLTPSAVGGDGAVSWEWGGTIMQVYIPKK